MTYVNDFYDKYFLKFPNNIGKVNRTVYLVTEDLEMLNEALKKLVKIEDIFKKSNSIYILISSFSSFQFIYNAASVQQASKQIKEKASHKWQSTIGLLDLHILSKCDFVVATFSSNFGRFIYEFMHIEHPNPFYKFKTLDSPYSILGYFTNILSNNYTIDGLI